jgi:hypothetical protein
VSNGKYAELQQKVESKLSDLQSMKTQINTMLSELKNQIATSTQSQQKVIEAKIAELTNEKTKLDNTISRIDNLSNQLNSQKTEVLAKIDSAIKGLDAQKSQLATEKDALLKSIQTTITTELKTKSDIMEKDRELLVTKYEEKNKAIADKYNDKSEELSKKIESSLVSQIQKTQEEVSKIITKSKNILTQHALSERAGNLAEDRRKSARNAEIILGLIVFAVVCIAIWSIVTSLSKTINPETQEVTTVINLAYMFARFSIALPFGLYAFHQTNKIKRELCLRDQYNHAAMVLSSYSGFFEFLKDSKHFTAEQQIVMTSNAFKEILDNEADKADKHELLLIEQQNKMLLQTMREISKIKILPQSTLEALEKVIRTANLKGFFVSDDKDTKIS